MDRQLTFYPLFGKSLSVAVKAVIAGDSTLGSYLEEYNEKWIQPSEEDRTPETHFSIKGEKAGELATLFRLPKVDFSRITLHLWRRWENNNLPLMAAARFEYDEKGDQKPPFGFSASEDPKKQHFINLVYLNASAAKPKPAGFEPLYIKMETIGKTTYLRITVDVSGNILTVTANLAQPSKMPKNLQTLSFKEIRKENPALSALRQKLFQR